MAAEKNQSLIKKTPGSGAKPNVADYATFRANFSWEKAAAELGGANGDFNMARIAIDRHVAAGNGATTAIRWLGSDQEVPCRELARMPSM